jgi:hypothetical protein
MNIANIFGLHLGCKVKFESGTGVQIYRIEKVCAFDKVIMTDSSFQYCVKFEDCKLLLKPLSAITEDDKVEFEKEFNVKAGSFTTIAFEELVLMDTREPLMPVLTRYTIQQELFLASRGFDVGIVPAEYKEVLK